MDIHYSSWDKVFYKDKDCKVARTVEELKAFITENQIDVNALDSHNRSVFSGKNEYIKALLELGADPTLFSRRIFSSKVLSMKEIALGKFKDDKTMLHCINHQFQAKLLIEAGADVNAKDVNGNTPLHDVQSVEVAIALIEAGADVNATNNKGQRPIDVAKNSEISMSMAKRTKQKILSHKNINPETQRYMCKMVDNQLFEMVADPSSRFTVIKYGDVTIEYGKSHIKYTDKDKTKEFDTEIAPVAGWVFNIKDNEFKEDDSVKSYYLSEAMNRLCYSSSGGFNNYKFERLFDDILDCVKEDKLKLSLATERFKDGSLVSFDKDGRKIYEKLSDGTKISYYENGNKKKEDLSDGTKISYYENGNKAKEDLSDGTKISYYENGYISKKEYSTIVTQMWKHDSVDILLPVVEKYSDTVDILLPVVEKYSDTVESQLVEKSIGNDVSTYKNGVIYTQTYHGMHYPKTYYYDKNGKMAFGKYTGGQLIFCDQTVAYNHLKEQFKNELEKGNTEEALKSFIDMCEVIDYAGHEYDRHADFGSLCVRNELQGTQLKVLDDGKVAFGAIYEDRHWVNETFKGNGIEWYWKASAIILDVEKGNIVASCSTARENVRHRTDPNLDLWNKIDNHDFMDFDGKTLKVAFKNASTKQEYAKASVEVDFEKYNQNLENMLDEKTKEQITSKMQKVKKMLESKTGKSSTTNKDKKPVITNVVLANKGKSGYGD